MKKLREPQWLPGPPAGLDRTTLTVDLAAYKPLVCPGCLQAGMSATPQHTADGRYRVLLCCPRCHTREEV